MSAQAREDFTDTIGPVAERHRRRVLGQVHYLRGLLDNFEAAARTTDGARWDEAAQAFGVNIIALTIMSGLIRGSVGSRGEA